MSAQEALVLVNHLHDKLAELIRSIVTEIEDDGGLSKWEALMLGFQAASFGGEVITMVKALDPQALKDMLYVLEHGDWTLPPGLC